MASDTMTAPTVTGVTPYINVEGASAASAFYQKAFGAKELMRMPAQDGKRLMHCHLEINGGPLGMASTTFSTTGSTRKAVTVCGPKGGVGRPGPSDWAAAP